MEDVAVIEAIIKKCIEDAASEIRDVSRDIFKAYTQRWIDQSEAFVASLPSSALKMLNLLPTKSFSAPSTKTLNRIKRVAQIMPILMRLLVLI